MKMMKCTRRIMALMLALIMGLALGGCKKEEAQETATGPTVRVEFSAWRYEQGYAPAEGWIYETILSDSTQVDELNGLVAAASFVVTDRDFELGQGYRLTFLDAAGNITHEELILSSDEATREGMLFELDGAEELWRWLEDMKLREETAE